MEKEGRRYRSIAWQPYYAFTVVDVVVVDVLDSTYPSSRMAAVSQGNPLIFYLCPPVSVILQSLLPVERAGYTDTYPLATFIFRCHLRFN